MLSSMSDTPNPDPKSVLPPKDLPSTEGGGGPLGPFAVPGPDVDELCLHRQAERDLGASSVFVDPVRVEQGDERKESHDALPPDRPVRRRRIRLPLILFLATCLSTFWVGVNDWYPFPEIGTVRQVLLAHWLDGLIYTGCLLTILLAHEMGHFIATLRYHVPASLPYFIPFPISPIGTMGAVIGMDGLRADRRELFDIGLAGPLAGLVVAIPIMWIGIVQIDLTHPGYGPFALDLPLLTRIGLHYLQPPGYEPGKLIYYSQLNSYFMAGWVGFLITGLNMLPVSQLDGGHVMYTLFGKKAHWVARGLVVLAVFMVLAFGQWRWSLMILLVLFIGPDHPPTSNDNMTLGRARTIIGCCATLIPIFCFAPRLIIIPG